MVYKLVEIEGVATIKLSDEIEKTTIPGSKAVIRVYLEDEVKPTFDVICCNGEEESYLNSVGKEISFRKPFSKETISCTPSRVELLTELLYNG
jgi:nicotinic acid phosphoribosyltransferase